MESGTSNRSTRAGSWGWHGPDHTRIGVLAVASISFFNVSGGPWGSEDIFSTVGPFYGTLGLLLFTIFFSLPQCLLTAELSCAFPTNGGYAIWVREAFGDFWGVQECYWQWVSGVIDAAAYPVLICDAAAQLMGHEGGRLEVWLFRLIVTLLLTAPTTFAVAALPAVLVAFAAISTVPVVMFVALGSVKVYPQVWMQKASGNLNVGKLVNALFWNLEGWDCISTCVAMINQPRERTIPRGLYAAIAVVSVQYLAVLLVAAGLGPAAPWQEWHDGSLPSIGQSLAPWMGVLLLVASVIGNAGQYLSEFFETSCMLQGTADAGIAPPAFGWRCGRSEVPYITVAFQLSLIMLLVALDFSDILAFTNAFTAAGVLLEFMAFIALRIRQPERKRPYYIRWPALLLVPPALLLLLVVLYHCIAKSWNAMVVNLLAFAVGVPYGGWISRRAQREEAKGEKSAFDRWLELEGDE